MLTLENRTILSLASILAMRMLGLFMILPVFSLYAHDLPGATPALVGMAMGIYGLTQAIFQAPFGILSDHYPRKWIITIGFGIFGIGSAIAAASHSIWGVMIGRAIQGAGAVGSVIIALMADLTREEQRTKAMAILGLTIGLSFAVAMMLGPLLNVWISVPGIFWLTAILAVLSILTLHIWVPTPRKSVFHADAELTPGQLRQVLSNQELQRLNIGIFILHAILTACFVAIPVTLETIAGLPESQQWFIYLPVLLLSFVTMLPFMIFAEKKRHLKAVFLIAIGILAIAELLLSVSYHSALATGICLWLFFTGFNLLEANLPSLISRIAPSASKGTAMGVYSSSQFLGIFIGGSVGGWLFGRYDAAAVFLFCVVLTVLWLIVARNMRTPPHLTTRLFKVGQINEAQVKELSQRLSKINGVREVTIMVEEGVAYLKVDPTILNPDDLQQVGVNA